MRGDMAKVVVERPRYGAGSRRRGRTLPHELLPKRIGLLRDAREHNGYKGLNENLAPLRRYLGRQVGRPWNKIYSEICENLKPSSTVQQHVRDHLKDLVDIHPVVGRRGWWRPELYVDPRTGLLRRRARGRRPQAPAADDGPKPIRLGPLAELRRVEGVWYEVTLASLPAPEYREIVRDGRRVRQLVTPAVVDAVTGAPTTAGPEVDDELGRIHFRAANPRRVYAAGKRQLSSRGLRRHGLGNVAEA